jgi:hypothetical protein
MSQSYAGAEDNTTTISALFAIEPVGKCSKPAGSHLPQFGLSSEASRDQLPRSVRCLALVIPCSPFIGSMALFWPAKVSYGHVLHHQNGFKRHPAEAPVHRQSLANTCKCE